MRINDQTEAIDLSRVGPTLAARHLHSIYLLVSQKNGENFSQLSTTKYLLQMYYFNEEFWRELIKRNREMAKSLLVSSAGEGSVMYEIFRLINILNDQRMAVEDKLETFKAMDKGFSFWENFYLFATEVEQEALNDLIHVDDGLVEVYSDDFFSKSFMLFIDPNRQFRFFDRYSSLSKEEKLQYKSFLKIRHQLIFFQKIRHRSGLLKFLVKNLKNQRTSFLKHKLPKELVRFFSFDQLGRAILVNEQALNDYLASIEAAKKNLRVY